ncbi:formyltransferase family protein [Amylibacter sp.]|jgi:methionyl-tRNA formyltransferase|nr:formyltransferase family protein [Amylibacter sp.]
MKKYRPSVILLGSKPASCVVFKKMLRAKWNIKCVVIPKKYDQSWMPKPGLADLAKKHEIPVYETQKDIPKEKVDLVISYMYRNLVKSEIIELAKKAALNFHPAPLPEFGGFAFYNVAIIEGVKEYGATCHHMDNNFDTGDLVRVKTFAIDVENETAISLEKRTQKKMLKLFDEVMHMVTSDTELPRIPQSTDEHRYLTSLEFNKLKVINPNWNYEKIQRYARAFWFPPYPCAHIQTNSGGKSQIVPDSVLIELGLELHSKDYLELEHLL